MADTMRRTVMVPAGEAVIETIIQGAGPALLMLPSLGRDGYAGFDAVAGLLAAGGLTVLRPQPRDKWDELCREFGDRVQARVIEDASHALFPEQPHAVADAVLSWVSALPA